MRVLLQPAFILHHRPYRETSLLLDVLTRDHGRVTLVARGVRKNRSVLRPLLQPFYPLLLSFQGRTDCMTLRTAEPDGLPGHLQEDSLLGGFYLNEILIRLLQKHDPHPQLYTLYKETLLELGRVPLQQKYLRLFEKKLLDELGYGLQLHHSIPDGKVFQADQWYQYCPEQGFMLHEGERHFSKNIILSGKSVLALASENLEDADILQEVKQLMRRVFTGLLGPKPLQSRKLFRGVTAE